MKFIALLVLVVVDDVSYKLSRLLSFWYIGLDLDDVVRPMGKLLAGQLVQATAALLLSRRRIELVS